MQSSSDDPVLAVLLELGAVVVELFEARDLLRAETPYAAFRTPFRSFWAYWHRGGAHVAPTEAGQANDEDRAAGVEVAPGAAEDAALGPGGGRQGTRRAARGLGDYRVLAITFSLYYVDICI